MVAVAQTQLHYTPSSAAAKSNSHISSQILTPSYLSISFVHPPKSNPQTRSLYLPPLKKFSNNRTKFGFRSFIPSAGGNGNNGAGGGGGGGGRDGSRGDGGSGSSSSQDLGVVGLLLSGWRSRVAADPQFPFKVLMEELVGLTACIIGDMSCRPNFGLNELDFVFSTLVVGSILNFLLMYLLAPTMASASSTPGLPFIFASCPAGHMFEPGNYTVLDRFGTFVYKGVVFAAVGFAAGLVGTAISNGLITMRKKMDPEFEPQNKPPPTLLNAVTWAAHMGLSSNSRYQTLNGIEFLLEKWLPPLGFKSSVTVLRCLNNVLGGMSFVTLAKLTGSQSSNPESQRTRPEDELAIAEKKRD